MPWVVERWIWIGGVIGPVLCSPFASITVIPAVLCSPAVAGNILLMWYTLRCDLISIRVLLLGRSVQGLEAHGRMRIVEVRAATLSIFYGSIISLWFFCICQCSILFLVLPPLINGSNRIIQIRALPRLGMSLPLVWWFHSMSVCSQFFCPLVVSIHTIIWFIWLLSLTPLIKTIHIILILFWRAKKWRILGCLWRNTRRS